MLRISGATPSDDGFFMPAEWHPHSRTWMLWPQRTDTWRLQAAPAQQAFAAVATAIAAFEPVTICANPESIACARALLPKHISVTTLPSNDAWMRDSGPTFVINAKNELRLVNWLFNAWGGLYPDWSLDEAIPPAIASMEGIVCYNAPLILEGGSIHVDGEGTLITTEECLLNSNRNPHLSRLEIEKYLCAYTGATKILWLGAGIYNDETSGHIDNIACFLRPGLVALAWTDDHNDPQYPISADAYKRLINYMDAKGRKLEVLKIHQPDPIFISATEAAGVVPAQDVYPRHEGERMAASYINFYLCNGAAIMPLFNDPHDCRAMQELQNALPGRKVVGIPSREILLGGGNIHCITQQQPEAVPQNPGSTG